MKKNTTTHFLLFALLLVSTSLVYASESAGTIDTTYHSAKVCHNDACTTYGSINFLPTGTQAPVTITDVSVTGYAWGDEMGWINFAPTGAGVFVSTSTGELSGTAWSQTSGWINFRPANAGTLSGGVPIGVSITPKGEFYGWAWNGGAYGGWIKFDCATTATCVKTDWRKFSIRAVISSASGFAPSPTPAQTSPTPTPLVVPTPALNNGGGSSGGSSIPTISQSTGEVAPLKVITKKSFEGVTSPEVKTLQLVLAQDKEIYPSGYISGYFGSATKKAVEAFQVKYGIVKKGEEGYGEVGPKTRLKINELLKEIPQS
jgi:hypothetical protein